MLDMRQTYSSAAAHVLARQGQYGLWVEWQTSTALHFGLHE